MTNKKTIKLLVLLILIIFTGLKALSQCTNTVPYPTAAIAAPNGTSTIITTEQWAGDYATISSVINGSTYISTSSVNTDFITIRRGTYNGTVIASGTTPLTWTATNSGNYYIHYNTNSGCGTQSTNRTTTIANVLSVPKNGGNSVTTCSGHIYDNGGPNSSYTTYNDGYTTIYPGTAGGMIQLTGSYYTESGYDHVYIYNGVGTSGAILLDGSTSSLTSIGTITSTDISGALTIRFISDGSIQNSGFDFAIACKIPCTVSNIPYSQDFESVTVPVIPDCTSIQNSGSGNNWETANSNSYGFLSNALRYTYHSTNAANAWFFTGGLNLIGGTSYRITFRYGNTGTTFPEKLKVAYGT